MNLQEIPDEELNAEMERRREVRRAAERERRQHENYDKYQKLLNEILPNARSEIMRKQGAVNHFAEQLRKAEADLFLAKKYEEQVISEILSLDIKEPDCPHHWRVRFGRYEHCNKCMFVVNRAEIEKLKVSCERCDEMIFPEEDCKSCEYYMGHH